MWRFWNKKPGHTVCVAGHSSNTEKEEEGRIIGINSTLPLLSMSATSRDEEPRVPDPSSCPKNTSPDKWNGVQVAKEAEVDSEEPETSAEEPEARINGNANNDDFSLSQQELLLEELLRLRLSASPGGGGTPGSNKSSSNASGGGNNCQPLPPRQRIQLYQPRTKLEQFEDILMESQLLGGSSFSPDSGAFDPEAFLNSASDADTEAMEMELMNEYGVIGLDFEVSDAIFSEKATTPPSSSGDVPRPRLDDLGREKSVSSSDSNDLCQCSSCQERLDIENDQRQELERLRQCWADLREDVLSVYRMVLDGSWNDQSKKLNLSKTKERIHKLCWKGPHQLFQRLEAGVKEFVLDIKLKLIELIQHHAKNPSLAEDFIKELLGGYEKLCSAAQHLAPALVDLEVEHLRRFSLTWEILNKHLYQSIIYTDPLIQNNLPIFISQLRSLYPDKESEKKYTELVRAYLDFDVEMDHIGEFWKTSEVSIQEYNLQQGKLRARQKMLKEDWEKFKAQRREFEKKMMIANEGCEERKNIEEIEEDNSVANGEEAPQSSAAAPITISLKKNECSSAPKSTPATACTANKNKASASSSGSSSFSSSSSSSDSSNLGSTLGNVGNFAKLYPQLYNTLKEDAKKLNIDSLASIFPAVNSTEVKSKLNKLTAGGGDSGKIAAELSEALSAALSLSVDNNRQKLSQEKQLQSSKSSSPPSFNDAMKIVQDAMETKKESSATVSICKTNTKNSSITTSTMVTKNTTSKMSANGNTGCKGNHHHGHGNHSKELNKLLHQHYCGHKKSQPSAKAIKRGKVPPPPLPTHDHDELEDETGGGGDEEDEYGGGDGDEDESESCHDGACSSSSTSTSNTADSKSCSCCYCEVFGHGGPSVAPVSRNYPEMRERLRLLLSKKKQKCRQSVNKHSAAAAHQSSASSNDNSNAAATTKNIVVPKIVANKSQPKAAAGQTELYKIMPKQAAATSNTVPKVPDALETKDVEELLDFIEGNQSSTNEKKKAKKERQKQQRLQEIREREEQERKRREAIEAEKKGREMEIKKQEELERQLQKKQKKKAAQKAKKAMAKGLPVPEPEDEEDPVSLEDLRLQQMREIQRLKMVHQQQLEEEERKLQQLFQQQNQKGGKDKQKKVHISTEHLQPKFPQQGSSSSAAAANLSPSLDSFTSNGPQIKITRTANGGAQFTPVMPTNASNIQLPSFSPTFSRGAASAVPATATSGVGNGSGQPPQKGVSNGNGLSFTTNGLPAMPSSSSNSNSSQPMVTIRGVQNNESDGSTVTMSTAGNKKDDKLLYTLVNGQIHRAKDSPDNLIPNAKPPLDESKLTKTQKKKLKKQQQQQQQLASDGHQVPMVRISQQRQQVIGEEDQDPMARLKQQASEGSTIPFVSPHGNMSFTEYKKAFNNMLPTTADGKVDLDRLQLPSGISITRIEGPVPERKYFPMPSNEGDIPRAAAGKVPSNDAISNPPPPTTGNGQLLGGYVATPTTGYPNDINVNGSDVIVVDTSSLATNGGDGKKMGNNNKKNKNKKKNKQQLQQQQQPVANGIVSNQQATAPSPPSSGSFPSFQPEIPELPNSFVNGSKAETTDNNLKSGPQVLIKNVNGKVVITPVPGTGEPMPPTEVNKKATPSAVVNKNDSNSSTNGFVNGTNNREEENSSERKKNRKNIRKKSLTHHEHMDDINSIFAPKDIDLDNGEMDDDEREIEAFKRFCFNSVPLQQKTKVNIDVKNIALKKK